MHHAVSIRRALLALALASAVALSGTAVLTAPASAAPAAPGSLSATASSNTPTFSWSRVDGAAHYELWVDQDPGFPSPTKQTTVNDRWVAATPLPNGPNYWEVRAVGTDGTPSGWTTGEVDIVQASGPVLVGPANNAQLDQPAAPPVLSWQPVPGATGYTITVTNTGTAAVKTYNTSNTSYVVPDLVPSGNYSWSVVAKFGSVLSLPSESRTYRIGELPQVTGATATDVNSNLVFNWNPVPGANSYNIWVSSDPNFPTTSSTVVPSTTTVYGTRYSPPANIDLGNYYWKVRAVNGQGQSITWDGVNCNGATGSASPTCTNSIQHGWTDKPTLLHPANALSPETSDPLYFQWTPVAHATYYELDLGTDPSFSVQGTTYQTCTTAETTYTPGYVQPSDKCMPSQRATYYWRVRAIDAPTNVNGLYSTEVSSVRSFVYESTPDLPVQQLSPVNGATVPVPTLTWSAATDAVKYHVVVTDSTASETATDTYALTWTPPTLDATKGPFHWTVQAVDADGKLSPLYAPGPSFSVSGSPATGAAALTPLTSTAASPTSSARFPNLRWEPLAGADHYKLCIGTAGTNTCDNSSKDSVLSTSFKWPAATSTDDGYLAGGVTYDWLVIAYNSSNVEIARSSSPGRFTITDLAQVHGTRLALDGNALAAGDSCTKTLPAADHENPANFCSDAPSTPVFAWNSVPEAGLYKVFVSTDPNLQNLVYGSTINNAPQTSNTYWAPRLNDAKSQLPDATAGAGYYWYILPCKTTTVCNSNPTSSANVTTNGFTKLSPAVAGGTATVDQDDVTFNWPDYLSTNQSTGWPEAAGDLSYQEAKQYQIQISTQASFPTGSGTWSATVDQTTFTPYSSLLPDGTLYWRVGAIDQAGDPLPWSPVQSFTKSSPYTTFGPQALTYPTNGQAVPGTVAFQWAPATFGTQYRISVFKNGDPTAPLFTPLVTNQTAYAPTTPIPVAGQAYTWQVERRDASGNWGSATAPQSFTVASETPTQQLPAVAATVDGNDVYFTWSQVPGAASYRLEYGLTSSTSTTTVSTSALEYAPTNAIAGGNYHWRVTALDSAGHALSTDAAFRPLTITGVAGAAGSNGPTSSSKGNSTASKTKPVIVSISPARTIRAKGSFRAVFNIAVKNATTATVKVRKAGSGKPVRVRVSVSADRRTVIVKPSKKLQRNKRYTISFSTAITSDDGVTAAGKSWSVKVK